MAKKKQSSSSIKDLTSQEYLTKLQDVKDIIAKRMKAMGLGPYDLAKLLKGTVTPQTVYNFTKGSGHMSTKNLPHVLAALGLEIRPKE